MNEPRYRIELTESQMALIARCVEDVCRFMSGQMDLFNSTVLLPNSSTVQDKLRECYPLVVPDLIKRYGGCNASYGWSGGSCPNKAQKEFIAQTYYLYREIYHQLDVNREPQGDWNVYQSETLRCADSGEPITITKLTDNGKENE
jgi:hypothetical protein